MRRAVKMVLSSRARGMMEWELFRFWAERVLVRLTPLLSEGPCLPAEEEELGPVRDSPVSSVALRLSKGCWARIREMRLSSRSWISDRSEGTTEATVESTSESSREICVFWKTMGSSSCMWLAEELPSELAIFSMHE